MPALDEQLLKDKKCLKDSIRLLKVSLKTIFVLTSRFLQKKRSYEKSRENWPVLKHDIGKEMFRNIIGILIISQILRYGTVAL